MAENLTVMPVFMELACDFITPVVLFAKINRDYSFILESVECSERFGRHSFIGLDPKFTVQFSQGKTIVSDFDSGQTTLPGNALDNMRQTIKKYKPLNYDSKSGFFGGAVGYMAYDIINQIENLHLEKRDQLNVPDLYFIVPKSVIIFDHLKHTIKLACNVFIDKKEQAATLYDAAVKRIGELKKLIKSPEELPLFSLEKVVGNMDFSSNMTREEFCSMVKKAKESIYKGDAFQIVLSQRLKVPFNGNALNLYRALRIVNPSPYMFLINFPGFNLVGSSPEILVKEEEGKVTIRPIAGTRKRGENEEKDKELEAELLADKKEIAEHVMLVDLARNDIGRVCKGGSVAPSQLMVVERYSHVMHIVSNVKGELAKDKDAFDLLKACFPAGTVSGAPKIRAMEIIEDLEPDKRGPYAGAVCYFDFGGNFDSCITIRTALLKEGMAYVQAGAGIVYDSVEENEYQESINKAKALLRAIELAKTINGETY